MSDKLLSTGSLDSSVSASLGGHAHQQFLNKFRNKSPNDPHYWTYYERVIGKPERLSENSQCILFIGDQREEPGCYEKCCGRGPYYASAILYSKTDAKSSGYGFYDMSAGSKQLALMHLLAEILNADKNNLMTYNKAEIVLKGDHDVFKVKWDTAFHDVAKFLQ